MRISGFTTVIAVAFALALSPSTAQASLLSKRLSERIQLPGLSELCIDCAQTDCRSLEETTESGFLTHWSKRFVGAKCGRG